MSETIYYIYLLQMNSNALISFLKLHILNYAQIRVAIASNYSIDIFDYQ